MPATPRRNMADTQDDPDQERPLKKQKVEDHLWFSTVGEPNGILCNRKFTKWLYLVLRQHFPRDVCLAIMQCPWKLAEDGTAHRKYVDFDEREPKTPENWKLNCYSQIRGILCNILNYTNYMYCGVATYMQPCDYE